MRYTVRKERAAWIVRDTHGRFQAGRRTHADAIHWADTLATYAHSSRWRQDIARIHASLERIKENR